MNLQQLKRNVGTRVQLVPNVCYLNEFGAERSRIDDDWIIQAIDDEEIQISNDSGYFVILGKDHIHHFTSNPHRSRSEITYGFLTLLVQIFIQGNNVKIQPTLRPGEAVSPLSLTVQDKVVNISYPEDSGLQKRLNGIGYKLFWSTEKNVHRRVDVEGWELVVEPDGRGGLASFRFKDRIDDLVLLKKLQ